MTNIITDKYTLTQTSNITFILPGGENKSDLNLSLNKLSSATGTVQGLVSDASGNPLQGALIKLMSQSYDPIMHSTSDSQGNYTLSNIPVNTTFKIYSISQGKLLQEGDLVNVVAYQKLTVNFILQDDPSSALGIIAGDILDLNSKTPIKGAIVLLYSINNGVQNLISTINSNDYGQFIFRDVNLGDYNLIVSSTGYTSDSSLVTIANQGQIIPLKVSLIQDKSNSNGTISGVINDETGNPIGNANVILYRLENNGYLTPISFTKTNSNGVYLFQDVPQATYKIKANENTTVKIITPNSPNYYEFTIANASSLIPTVTSIEDEATLSNGAIYVLNNSFVAGLGGVTGGVMNMNVTAPTSAYYTVDINYLSGNSDTTIILQQDPDNNGTQTTLNFPKTNSWTLKDAKTLEINIPLYAGINQFLLFNTQNTETPWIGDFSIQYIQAKYEALSSDAETSNGAIYLAPFITNLGGPNNGAANFTIDIPFTQVYKLGITYLAGDTDRPLKLDIDNVNQANLTLPKTNDWSLLSEKVYELDIQVEEGERNFNFYNDTGEYAANVGNLTFNEYTIDISLLPKDVILSGSAKIETDSNGSNYITGITSGSGKIQISIVVSETQLYDFEIQYKCQDDRICNVTVNNIPVTYEDFTFLATGNSIGTFYTQLYLTQGNNIIDIFNE